MASSPLAHRPMAFSPPAHQSMASSTSTYFTTSGSSAVHFVTMSGATSEPGISGLSPGQSFSPSVIRPFPKAGPRKTTVRTKKKRQSEILTDTPEKQALMQEEQRRGSKNLLEGLTLQSPSVVILCSFAWIDEGPTPTQINEDSEAFPEERSAYAAVSLWTTIGADYNHQR
ncbi:hypothetical protein G5714_001288 [Onychostoma macrolepis]|uniref:Uncharacterized protein n=1 Tax=Onychostoma macrolepis TaxID=369639 RepID=A0A7J6DCH8_9TELE|nr:hypothetical protein G5714_001288 [Onychostoma macrolepis]